TGIKCSTKFQALKRTYKSVIDHNKKSGNNRQEWEYFKIMQDLFSEKPWVQAISEAGSHVTKDPIDEIMLMGEETDRENILSAKRNIDHMLYITL
ncbi:uncharacterized protein LOC116844316, partial [Odontomachus brunneus]|uniref:uncharacterized protein LOC116844316 n=1 Tax=Odontomachus brunneus TaxID=486640 RepID=UPI0013F1B3D4